MQKAQGSFAALRHDGTVVSWGIPRSGGDSSEVQDQYLVLQQQLGPTVSLPVFTFPETNSSPLKIVWDPKGNVIFKSLIFMGEFLVSGRVPRKSEQFQKDSKDCFVFCLHSSCMFRCCMIAVGNIGPEWMFFLEIRQDQFMLKMNYIYIFISFSTYLCFNNGVFHGRKYKLVDVVMSNGVTGTLQACLLPTIKPVSTWVDGISPWKFPCFIRYKFGSTPHPVTLD